MKLWSGLLSPFTAKVRIALAEKSLAYETLDVPWTRATLWEPKPEAFLAVSPKGEVPVLIDNDSAIVDSTIILEYLEEAYPQTPLMPGDAAARAECRMWEDMGDHYLAHHVTTLIREVFMQTDPTAANSEAIAGAMGAFAGYHQHLNRKLAERDYLCGAFGIADITNFIALGFGATLGAAIDPSLAHLTGWYARVYARPAVKTDYDQMMQAAAKV